RRDRLIGLTSAGAWFGPIASNFVQKKTGRLRRLFPVNARAGKLDGGQSSGVLDGLGDVDEVLPYLPQHLGVERHHAVEDRLTSSAVKLQQRIGERGGAIDAHVERGQGGESTGQCLAARCGIL